MRQRDRHDAFMPVTSFLVWVTVKYKFCYTLLEANPTNAEEGGNQAPPLKERNTKEFCRFKLKPPKIIHVDHNPLPVFISPYWYSKAEPLHSTQLVLLNRLFPGAMVKMCPLKTSGALKI